MTEREKLNILLQLSLIREQAIGMQATALDQAGALGDFRYDIEKLARELNTRPEEGDKVQPEGTDQ